VEHRNFDTFNASFAKYEQRNSTAIFADEPELEDLTVELEKPAPTPTARPKPQPRATADLRAEEEKAKEEAARQLRAEEDARLEAELRLNEERLREEEEAMQRELEEEKERQKQLQMDEQQRREAKRWEEDQRLLSFAKRSTSLEEPVPEKQELKHERELVAKQEPEKTLDTAEPEPEHNFLTPEQSPKEFQTNGSGSGSGERWEKRLGKFKYGNKRGELMYPNRNRYRYRYRTKSRATKPLNRCNSPPLQKKKNTWRRAGSMA